ncbi:MAG: GNAT family N-acetyltransferase [Rhodospirillales bacterium]|nr:GNAT family N-acetyltransferase [Rhodospirillales bacterium]
MVPVLETERLVLRPFADSDLDHLVELIGDADVAAMTSNVPHPYTRADGTAWLERRQSETPEGDDATLAIQLRSGPPLVGSIALWCREKNRVAEIGYWLGQIYWNRGYMTEAAQGILRYAFDELGYGTVYAWAFTHNLASRRVQEKLGMTLVETRLRLAPARNREIETTKRRITAEEWRNDHRT